MKDIVRPQDLDPASRERIIGAFKRRTLVRYVLHGIVGLCLVLVLISYRYGESLFGKAPGTERGALLGIAALFLAASVLYWRCPHCGWRFLWRLNPRTCWNCGVRLVVPRPKPVETEEVDFRDYIKIRERNTLKYWLFFILITGVDIGLMLLLGGVLPFIAVFIIFMVLLWLPLTIIENKYLVCPKCGEKYAHWWDRSGVPQVCSNCKTMLKHYPRW